MIKLCRYFGIAILFLAASCGSPRKAIYFNTHDKADSVITSVQSFPRPEVIIKPDDIVAVNVSSVDAFTQADPVAIFNNGGVNYNVEGQQRVGQAAQGTGLKGYLVDNEGYIDFPVIGKVKIGGLNPTEVKKVLAEKISNYLKSPVVEIRVINFKVNMLGELSRVGPVLVPNHKISILEAIAAAGDIPITGRRDNVLLIREKDGKQEFARLNLNSKSIFSSPYYYLQKNDILYVEPNRLKRQETNEFIRFYLPALATIVSSVLSIYGIVQLTKAK